MGFLFLILYPAPASRSRLPAPPPPLCHTLSSTQLCHTHHLSHTTLSHTIFHIQLYHTHTTLHIQLFKLLDPPPPPLSFLPSPSRFNFCCSLLEEVDLWGYPVLQFLGRCSFCGFGSKRLLVKEFGWRIMMRGTQKWCVWWILTSYCSCPSHTAWLRKTRGVSLHFPHTAHPKTLVGCFLTDVEPPHMGLVCKCNSKKHTCHAIWKRLPGTVTSTRTWCMKRSRFITMFPTKIVI